MKKFIFLLSTAVINSIFLKNATAATASTNMAVNATVLNNCSISASALNFGNYSSNNTNDDVTSTVTVNCTVGLNYAVGLSTGGSGSFTNRLLTNGLTTPTTIPYNIYTNATRTIVWGDGTGTTQTVPGTAVLNGNAITAYGRIPATTANLTAGTYSDTVVATVTY